MVQQKRVIGFLGIVLFIVLQCLGGGLANEEPLTPGSSEDKQFWWRAIHPHNWDLRLTSVELEPKGIVKVRGTLQNLSVDTVKTPSREATENTFALGVRIWRRGVNGSYRLRANRPPPNVIEDPEIVPIILAPGEMTTISWQAYPGWLGTRYDLVVSEQYSINIRVKPAEPVTLQAGEYIIDATLGLPWRDPIPTDLAIRTTTIPSSNKLWITLEGPSPKQE